MHIPDSDIKKTISGIVEFFKRRALSALNVHEHFHLQKIYLNQLEGIHCLFIGNAKIKILLDAAKLDIKRTVFQSGDLCRSPVQSSDAVGQGSNQL